jgi:RNA polymerase sigma-32 factor
MTIHPILPVAKQPSLPVAFAGSKARAQASAIHLPTLPDAQDGLNRYMTDIRTFPMLTLEQEQDLANRWIKFADVQAAHQLVTSHLRLVAKIALGYRGYGLPTSDLIAEGNIGLMQAVKRFDPSKGFRLATYASWWIKASIQEYVLRSWSLVKIGTTAGQKKLFFNLRKLKAQLSHAGSHDLNPESVQQIANQLKVTPTEVLEMDRRMAGHDLSLNTPIGGDDSGNVTEWQDTLEQPVAGHEVFEQQDEFDTRKQLLRQAMDQLNDREKAIYQQRRLRDPARTLEELSQTYNISRERVRQIETAAHNKVMKYLAPHLAEPAANNPLPTAIAVAA